jgi:hypothetical protein
MDFIVGLPTMQSGYDSIWVIVDRFLKVAHFIPVKSTYKGAKLAELYIVKIVCLHRVPKKIVSNRGTKFTSRFWEKLHEPMDTKLNFSLAYHPQIDGQTERVNQILEDWSNVIYSFLNTKIIPYSIKSLEFYTKFPALFINLDLALIFEFPIQSNPAILQSNP